MEKIFTSTGLKTVGLTTALCDASSLKNPRHTVQLLPPVFCKLLKEAFESSQHSETTSMDDWIK